MNCLEFRRKLLEQPNCSDKEFLEHAATCAECNREHRHALQFESELFRAMDVEPPANLESRILHAVKPGRPQRSPIRHPLWLASAASVLLLLGVWLSLSPHWGLFSAGSPQLVSGVLEHIDNEPQALTARDAIAPAQLQSLFAQFGASLTDDLGPVRHATRCRMRLQDGIHLVLAGRHGPVTVLIMPGDYLTGSVQVSSSHASGVIIPTDYGSMAVVGTKTEFVEGLVHRLQQAVGWDA